MDAKKINRIGLTVNSEINPYDCPLCGKPNLCGNLSTNKIAEQCWCLDEKVKFSSSLLAQIPEQKKNKACICQACFLRFNLEKELITEVK